MRCIHCGARITIARLVDGIPSCEPCSEYMHELADLLHLFDLYTESRDGVFELVKGDVVMLRGSARALCEFLNNQPIPYRVSKCG
jgi:reverse gyrase